MTVCEYCYNFITQFHEFYEIVKENQDYLENDINFIKIEQEIEPDVYDPEMVIKDEEDPIIMAPVRVKNEKVAEAPNNVSHIKKETKNSVYVVKNDTIVISDQLIQKYKAGGSLDSQVKSRLKGKSLFICDHCDKNFTNKTRIAAHVIKCNMNRLKSSTKVERPSYRRVPKPHELTVPCPLCPPNALKFKNTEILSLHLTEHDRFELISQQSWASKKKTLMQCPHCERRFGNDDEFEAHLKNHKEGRFMTCELCGRSIVSSSLKTHLKLHFKRFCCEFCSHKFRNRSDLMKHIRLNHDRPDNYECHFCMKKIRHKPALEKHLEFCRGPGSVGPCVHCGQNFVTKSDRMYHVQKFHTGYVCRMCNLQLEGVTALKNHRKSEQHKNKSYEARMQREKLKQEKLLTKKAPLRKVTFGINLM